MIKTLLSLSGFSVLVLVAWLFIATPSYAKGGARSTGSGHSHSTTHTVKNTPAASRTHVHGYTKKDGTRVQSHDRTASDKTKKNNWSTKGNVNPETGKAGSKKGD
jgi:hypothetical protein